MIVEWTSALASQRWLLKTVWTILAGSDSIRFWPVLPLCGGGGKGSDVNLRNSARLWIIGSSFLWFGTVGVRAHLCGPAQITLEVGKACLWRVYADHLE